LLPDVSDRDGGRDDRRDRRRGLPAHGAAARDLQPSHAARKRKAHGRDAAGDRGTRAVDRVHPVDRDLPETDSAAHGALRARLDRADQARDRASTSRDRGRAAVNLDPSVSRDLLLSLLPELVLTGWALVLLLFVAWRHQSVRDL